MNNNQFTKEMLATFVKQILIILNSEITYRFLQTLINSLILFVKRIKLHSLILFAYFFL